MFKKVRKGLDSESEDSESELSELEDSLEPSKLL